MFTKSPSRTLVSRFRLAAVLVVGIPAGALADDAVAPAVAPVPGVSDTVSIVVAPGAVAAQSVDPATAISSQTPASSTEELSLSPYGNGPAGDCPHHRRKVVLVPTS